MKEIKDLILEMTEDLENRISSEYSGMLDYPSMQRKYERDMEIVVRAKKLLDIFEV